MLPLLAAVRAAVDVPVAALPVPYHTHDGEPTFQSLGGGAAFPVALDPFTSTRFDVAQFASRYSPDMSKARLPRLGPEPAGGEPRVRGAFVALFRCAVVGGGGIGSAAAYRLSRREGEGVLCLEQGKLGHGEGASEDHSRIIRRGYHSAAYTALTGSAYDAWREVEAESGVPLVHTTGMVNVARRGSEGAEILDAYTAAMDEFAIGHERFDATELMRRWPQFRVPEDHEALFQPEGGILDTSTARTAPAARPSARAFAGSARCRARAAPDERAARGSARGGRGRARSGGLRGRAGPAAGLEPRDHLVEAQLLEAVRDGVEFAGAELDEALALLAQLERLAEARLAGVEAADDLLDASAGGLVGSGGSVAHDPSPYGSGRTDTVPSCRRSVSSACSRAAAAEVTGSPAGSSTSA
jgi:hypothetical protein